MTWLQGITTWGAVVDKLTRLACGEIPDDSSVTCVSGDRWVRHISGQDLIRTHDSTNVNTGNVSFRAGYFTLVSYDATSGPSSYGWRRGICKQTVAWSGVPTSVPTNRWMLTIAVRTSNTTPGDYSTARINTMLTDTDTLSTVYQGSSLALNTAGDIVINNGTRTMTINLTDPSGTLVRGTVWCRFYNATYLGGIDYHGPFFRRRTSAATYSISPPGTAGTDYDLEVDIPSIVSSTGQHTYQVGRAYDNVAVTALATENGGQACGVGIKTTAGLTGALYTCSWNMFQWSLRLIAQTAASNGTILADHNTTLALDGATYRRVGGFTLSPWLQPFVVPGSVDPTSPLQYFMSVKPNKIVIILNGDPGASGVTTDAAIWTFTPVDYLGGNYDKFPQVCSYQNQQGTSIAAQVGQQWSYMQQVVRQDTSAMSFPTSRDWQTRWGRSDTSSAPGIVAVPGDSYTISDLGQGIFSTGALSGVHVPGVWLNLYQNSDTSHPNVSSKPNNYTGKWRMYGFAISDVSWGNAATGSTSPSIYREQDVPRGYVAGSINSAFQILPGGLWATGDELTDVISGKKWFLVRHDAGSPGILQFSSGAGLAILEE